MSTFWWKIIVLQILIAAISCTTELELDDNTKLSNDNIHWLLFKKMFEDINNPRIKEESNIDIIEIIEDLNQEENDEKSTNRFKNIPIITFEAPQKTNSNKNFGQKRNHYVTTLCRFKICNKKRSYIEYDNFIRYLTKNMNPQQF